MSFTIFNGTLDEKAELMLLIGLYCDCGPSNPCCSAHSILSMPQKQLDMLVFQRRYWAGKYDH